MKLKSFKLTNNTIYYLTAFFLPFVILFLALLAENISFNGETTILASDGFHQYVIFAENLRNILHGSDSLFYTFTSGLGLNFYALISYYLGSFFSPFVYFFSLKSMPDAIYLFTLLKVACMGLTSFYSLRQLYPKVLKPFTVILSSSYALMSFAISQIEINMWLDVFILLPLIILGLNRLLNQKKFILYYLTLTILFIQNYYFGYMVAIFLVLYFLVQISKENHWKIRGRQFVDFTVVSILAGLSSCVMLLPTYLDLSTHGEKFSTFTEWFTENSWFLDLFAKNFVGAYDTTKFGSIPMIYVGIFPLILAIIFFTIKSIKWQTRLASGIVLLLIIASFYLEPLDLLWQGMHSPNMFLHRYSWAFSLMVILLAAETLSHLKELTVKHYLVGIVPLGLGFLATVLLKNHYQFLEAPQIIITFSFLAAYAIILISYAKQYLTFNLFISFTVLFTVFENSLNTYYQITALNNEWVFPSRQSYELNLTDTEKLIQKSQNLNTTFYRTEELLPQTGNDSMKYNYHGISQFSSIRNTTSSSTLDRLGFKSTGTNLNLRYQNNTLLMDSLFAVKYNLSETDVNKFGFRYLDNSGNTSLYENQYASQLAILTNGLYKDVDFSVNTLDNQTNWMNNLTGLSEKYFTRVASQLSGGANLLNGRVTTSNDGQLNSHADYNLTVAPNTQLYISVPNITFSNENSQKVQITVNGKTAEYTTDNAYTFFDLGYFEDSQTLHVTLSFPENNQVSFNQPNFYALDTTSYQKAMEIINHQKVKVTTNKNTVTATYKADKASSLLFTIPYDKGWTATQNGKKITLSKAQDGFMKVDVKSGKGKVILTYLPTGFKEGAMLSSVGLLLFICYNIARKRKNKKYPLDTFFVHLII
ncbi:copper ABC transporter permease [Streptococcus equinus JB1]|uniref:Copper ABC transporter permease n=1 Tax=Streptococcus equinus JB1 TaxID=1294274 RepID=A0A091BSP0_STREI|nr:YfhO family protein [Streptococcus equinus]KFN88676.1 copper ABC transporter permease [Streptococcus equinus JB1]